MRAAGAQVIALPTADGNEKETAKQLANRQKWDDLMMQIAQQEFCFDSLDSRSGDMGGVRFYLRDLADRDVDFVATIGTPKFYRIVGKRFREIFLQLHKGLIRRMALKFNGYGVPLDDLMQYGWSGLEKAYEKYNSDRGYKFSGVATVHIRNAIIGGLAEEYGITYGQFQGLMKVVKARAEIRRELDKAQDHYYRAATIQEISKCSGGKKPEFVIYYLRLFGLRTKIKSLSATRFDEDDDSKGAASNRMACEKNLNPGDLVPQSMFDADMEERLVRVIGNLDIRRQKVLALRFGLPALRRKFGYDEEVTFTLDDIAKGGFLGEMGRERVRQIEAKALKDLRDREFLFRDLFENLS